MADVQSNIRIDIQTAGALANLKNLQRQISAFHTQMAKGSASAQAASANMQQNLINSVNATGKFTASMTRIRTTTESFTNALEKNKLTMGQYFRYAGASTKTFGRAFRGEFNTINKVARERVKDLQTQYVKMGRDASGAMRAIAVRPVALDLQNFSTQSALAAQKQQIFNQLLRQGSTNLLNWGKNTQWAGRQLMVGFTIPLGIFATVAGQTFMKLEEQAIKFRRVYGDLFTTPGQTEEALQDMRELAQEFTRFGVAVEDTLALAADVAQMGNTGAELQAQVREATRLAVLGGIEQSEALNTTVAVTNAFGIAAEDLANKIDFLNAVENQTILSIEDFNEAIPRAGSVVNQLGGSVEDLAFFLTAMREGGVNASQGANALKSSLGRLINPTEVAVQKLGSFGIDILGIVDRNAGNISATVVELGKALDTLDPLDKARAIEQLFGKFQFARMATLFNNINKEGSQAAEVLRLMAMETGDLGALATRELGRVEEAVSTKFRKAIEQFQAALAPIGEAFLKIATPLVEFGTKVLDAFNNMSDGAKQFAVAATAVLGLVAPVALMLVGLIANGAANILKFVAVVRNGFQKAGQSSNILGEQFNYMTQEQIEASAVASSLNQSHMSLQQTFTSEAAAVDKLTAAYKRSISAQQAMIGGTTAKGRVRTPKKYASGVVSVPGSGRGDKVPAMLEPKEAVIPADMAEKYAPLIEGMVNDSIPGFQQGRFVERSHLTMPFSRRSGKYQEAIRIAGLEELSKKFPQFIKVTSNLVAELPKRLNQAMKGKGVSTATFQKEFGSRQDKLLTSAQLGGLPKNQENIAALRKIEKEIEKRAISLAKGTKDQRVNDQILAKATKEVIAEQKKKKGAVRKSALALEKSAQQVGQVRVEPTADQLRRGISSGEFTESKGRVYYGSQQIARTRSSGGFRPADARVVGPSYSRKAMQSVEEGVKATRKSTQATKEQTQAKKKSTAATNKDTQATKRSAAAKKGWETRRANAAMSTGGAGAVAAPAKTAMNLGKLNNVIMSSSFALTSLAGAGSMMGGAIGKVSEKIFQFSGILFALMTVTQLLTQAKIAELAITAKNNALGAIDKVRGAGGFMGGAKGFKGIGNIFKNLGGIVTKVVGRFARFIPIIGGVVTALGVFKFFLDQKKEVEQFGQAARLTTDQLKNLGSALGIQAKTTSFAGQFTEATTGPEGANLTQQLLQSEDFAKQFETQISAVSKMGREEAERTLQSLTAQLSAAGFDEAAVGAIISAIATEAKRTDLDLSFQKIDINTDAGLQAMTNLAQASVQEFNKAFSGPSFARVLMKGFGGIGPLGKQAQAVAGQFTSMLTALKTGFESGDISAEQFNEQLDGIISQLHTIDPEALEDIIPQIAENLGIEEQLEGIESVRDQILLIEAATAGVKIPANELRLLEQASKAGADSETIREANRLRTKYNKLIKQTAKETEAANKEAEETEAYNQAMANANETLDEKKERLENEEAAFQALRDAGVPAAEAINMISDATVNQALASAETQEERDALIEDLREIAALQERSEERKSTYSGGGGGGGQKSPYAQTIEDLQDQQKELQNSSVAFNKLRQSGMDAGRAFQLAEDPITAAALASTKVGTAKWNRLIGLMDQVRNMELQSEVGLMNRFDRLMDSANKIYDLQEIRINRRYDKRIRRLEDVAYKAQQQITKIQDEIEKKQRQIELTITRPLELLQQESAVMANDLAIMDKQTEDINKKYNDQKKALQDIEKINKDIVAQKKSQLSLADALSQGDISAAAQQMQQMRAQRAQSARTGLMTALDAAREAEVAGLRGAETGMTRDQIADREFEIQQQTYQLEQRRRDLSLEIRDLEDEVYTIQTTTLRNAERQIESLQRQRDLELRSIQDKRQAWEEAKAAQEVAKIAAEDYNAAVAAGLDLVSRTKNTWESIKSRTITLTVKRKTVNMASGGEVPNMYAAGGKVKAYASGGKVYMAAGGAVPMKGGMFKPMAVGGTISSRNSDSVPAMLTPGEFVMNRRAARKFGPLLQDMNSNFRLPQLGGASIPSIENNGQIEYNTRAFQNSITDNSNTLYNYNLNVNVEGSNASPREIANVVMNEIKRTEGQALRRQVIR